MSVEQHNDVEQKISSPAAKIESVEAAQTISAEAQKSWTDMQGVINYLEDMGSGLGEKAQTLFAQIKIDENLVQLAATSTENIAYEPRENTVFDIKTANGTVIRMQNLEDYDPSTTPNLLPKSKALQKALKDSNRYDDISNIVKNRNLENTDPKETLEWLQNHVNNNPDVLNEFGITNISNISPKQAIALLSQIVKNQLSYDRGQLHILNAYRWHDNDTDSIPELLDEGEGICRNYAMAIHALFEALKSMQAPETNQLQNTYSAPVRNTNNSKTDRLQYGVTSAHAWNNFYTIESDGSINTTSIDATLEDGTDGLTVKAEEQILMEVSDLESAGLINYSEAAELRLNWLENPNNWTDESFFPVLRKAKSRFRNDSAISEKIRSLEIDIHEKCTNTRSSKLSYFYLKHLSHENRHHEILEISEVPDWKNDNVLTALFILNAAQKTRTTLPVEREQELRNLVLEKQKSVMSLEPKTYKKVMHD